MSEAQRFERLRAQDGKPLIPPPAVHGLLGPGGLDPAKAQQAVGMWQATQAELGTVYSFPAEERLFWCFFLLSSLYAGQGDRRNALSLAQQTLPLLQDIRHQQIAMGGIARYSALLGDAATANHMVAQLQTHSEDLQIDTNYRFSTAYVATMRGDDQAVLTALGYNPTDIPISDAYDQICAVLRANAHERSGRAELAQQQLMPSASTPKGVNALEEIVRKSSELQLIPRTMQALHQYAQQINANVVTTKSGVSIGGIMLLPILGLVVFGGGGALLSRMPVAVQGTATVVSVVVFIAISFVFAGRLILRGPMQRKKLNAIGVDGMAQILGIETTGTRVNHQPMYRFRMLVTVPNRTPYLVIHNEILAPGRVQQLPPGSQLRIKVDPKDPRVMAIIWG